jgi:hypothetical protein
MTNYITVQDVLDKLEGIDLSAFPDINTSIENVYIPSAQVAVNDYLSKNITEVTRTKYFDGKGLTIMSLGVTPIQNISECVIYSVPYTSTYLNFANIAKVNVLDEFGNIITTEVLPGSVTQLVLDCGQGIMRIPEGATTTSLGYLAIQTFILGNRNIKVTFTSGYSNANMPKSIKDAAAYMAAIYVLLAIGNDVSNGVSIIKIGQVTKTFGYAAGQETIVPYAGVMKNYENLIMLLLNPFKDIRV